PKKLDQIQVRNSQNQLVKTAFLNYSYFNSLQSDGPKFKRLKLDGITVDDQVYSFEYELPNSLPAKDTFNKDFWGFYNGTGNSSHAVPSFARYVYDYYYEIENLVRFQGSNRKSNFNYARAGVLNKINYPTGGFTSFEYESNKAAVNKPINNSTLDYNYAYLSDLPVVGTANYPQTVVGIGQQFTITDETPHILGTYNFSATINLTCSYNCSASTSSSPILKITNVNTNEEQTMFTYYSPGYGSQLITANQSLSPGTYVLSILPYVNAPGNPTVGLNATLDNAFYVEYNGNVQIPDDVQEFEVGGLRIKRIINSDGFQNISVREFDYTMQRYGKIVSSGVLMDQLVYHSKMGFYDYTPESFNQEISISSGPSLMTNPSAQGIHIGYSYVKETFKGSGNGNNGHILSNYHNSANSYVVRHVGTVPASNPANGINSKMELRDVNYGNVYVLGIPPLVYDYKNGSLLSESIFDSLGNEVSRVERDYLDVANSTNNTIKVLYQGSIGGQAVTGGNVLADFAYAVLGRTTLLEEERQYTFSGIDSHLKTTNFLYNNRNLTESVSAITSSSGGSPPVVKIEYKYPFDFATPAYVDLVGKNRVAQPVEVTTYRGQTLVTGGTRTEYQTFTGVGGKSFNEPIRELVYNTESLAFEERLTYTDYDNEGNLLEYLSPDEKRMAFRWGYDNTVPVIKAEEAGNGLDAAIQNALPTGYTSLEQLLDNLDDIATNSSKRSLWSSFNQSLRSQPGMEDAMIYTYTYKPLLGFTSETGPSGLVRYYQYDTNNRLYQVIDQDGHVVNQYEYNYNSTN
ncbi:MAG: hypothetical protein KI790_05755, partial [Cyclobacteriaceae bacterium]|nr:hypothetical protein [Cyclobacteriaceae bacterium HetDA_MAG_MS6]